MKESQIEVKNLLVHYKVFGQGRPMLILHGWPSGSGQWASVAELLAKKNIMVVIPDLPGFGFTPKPQIAWNLDGYVELIHEFSNKVPELRQDFYLLGHSFGGAVAIKFAVKYNQRVKKLFLVSAACIRTRTLIKQFLGKISKGVKIFSFMPGYQFIRKFFYKFIIRKSDYPHLSGIMKDIYLRIISEDLSHYVSFLKVPTVIIWGDKDNFTPLENANVINKKIENSKLIIIPGARHSLQLQIPEILAQKICNELESAF